MSKSLAIIPQFLQDPQAFYQSIQKGEDIKNKAISLFLSSVLFLLVYGFVTGLSHSWAQALSTAVKMPLLFLLTLAFCLPALYFFALALLGNQLSIAQVGVVVLSGIGVTAFLLLGLAPVVLFFVLTSTNYPFFQLVAVIFVAVSGFIGLYYLLRGLTWVDKDKELTMGSIGRILLGAWVALYGFVGAQMTWRLSPLIGDPEAPFVLIRPSRDNFFIDVIRAIEGTFGISRGRASSVDYLGAFLCFGFLTVIALMVGVWLGSRRKQGSAPQ